MGVRVGVENFFLDQSIGIDEINTFLLTFFSSMKIVGATDLGVMGVRVGVASSRDKLALRTRLRDLNLKSRVAAGKLAKTISPAQLQKKLARTTTPA